METAVIVPCVLDISFSVVIFLRSSLGMVWKSWLTVIGRGLGFEIFLVQFSGRSG